jgi:hypothetical protein
VDNADVNNEDNGSDGMEAVALRRCRASGWVDAIVRFVAPSITLSGLQPSKSREGDSRGLISALAGEAKKRKRRRLLGRP